MSTEVAVRRCVHLTKELTQRTEAQANRRIPESRSDEQRDDSFLARPGRKVNDGGQKERSHGAQVSTMGYRRYRLGVQAFLFGESRGMSEVELSASAVRGSAQRPRNGSPSNEEWPGVTENRRLGPTR
jgi:hypothetical protein